MLDRYLRLFKEDFFAPFINKLTPSFITPNVITTLALIVGISGGFISVYGYYYSSLILWLLGRLLDGVDGVIARARAQKSYFGAYYDLVGDHIVYFFVPFCLALSKGDFRLMSICCIMIGIFYVNCCSLFALSSLLEAHNMGAKSTNEVTAITMPSTLIEGSETLIYFCFFFVFSDNLEILFIVFSLLVTVNIIQRLVWAKRHLKIKN